jgi:DNA-binding HxlR family transcriptional regulator
MNATENCPVAATLELIGGKYKALILWHLSQASSVSLSCRSF